MRHGKCRARQLAVGEQAVKLALQRLQAGQPLMARQDRLIATEGAGEQRLGKQQAVSEAECPARTRLASAVVAGHGPSQLQAAAAQLGQGDLPFGAEGHHQFAITVPEGLQQRHGVNLFITRLRTRYSPPIRQPIRT
ncbi:hypothetical protein D3C87_1281590 [compost metagenome]